MQNNIKKFIKEAILELIDKAKDITTINRLVKKHLVKIHFIPIKYRVFTGLLQSMNIKFGNFIEKLLHIIVENENKLTVYPEISGKRNIKLPITHKSDSLIDAYITNCQNNNCNDGEILVNFNKLIHNCMNIEKNNEKKEINIKHDIDILFSINDDNFYYLEVKYNDDHDSGKYVDINRKFIKSYIGICNVINIYDSSKFKPILFYMTKKRMIGNIFVPEKENIYRGGRLFEEFFTIKYDDLDNLMQNIADDQSIVSLFDDLYNSIRFKLDISKIKI
jgi:hypothetical protein